MPACRRWAAALALTLLVPCTWAARVTLVVVALPRETPAGATLTLASSAGGWDAQRPAFAPDPQGRPTLTFDLPTGTLLQFKVTRGSWATAEALADGSARPNRLLAVKGDARQELRIERWVDLPTGGPRSTLSGDIERLADVWSPELGNRRDVLVWLPPGYRGGSARYPVLYMHDGSNVFDAATSFSGIEWRADEAAADLARRGHGLIIVAIAAPRDGSRLSEYGPWPMPSLQATGRADAYADFVARTLKPQIDLLYRTLPGRASGVLGSSMGGLVSLYMALRDPQVWGFAGALSPSLWFADGRIFEWVAARPAAAALPRVWLDMGTQEGDTLPAAEISVAQAREMARRLRRKGIELRFVVARGAHTEAAWAQRLPAALEWLVAR